MDYKYILDMDFTDKVLFPFPQKRTYPHLSLTPRGKQIPPNGKNVQSIRQ